MDWQMECNNPTAGKKFFIVGTNKEANNSVGNILLQKSLFKDSVGKTEKQTFRDNTVVIHYLLNPEAESNFNVMLDVAEDPKLLFVVDGGAPEGSVALYEKIKDHYKTLVLTGDNVTAKGKTDIESLKKKCNRVAVLDADDSEPEQREKLLYVMTETVPSSTTKRLSLASEAESRKSKITREDQSQIRPLFITTVGGPGTGKSSTANTLLGYPALETDLYDRKQPKEVKIIREASKRIAIFDTPGDLNSNICSDIRQMAKEQDGYHIILLIMKISARMTEEEHKRIGLLKKLFGIDYLQRHLCIVFTYGDEFMVMQRQGRVPAFKKYIWSENGPGRDLLQLCNGRCELVNNVATSSEKEEENRMSLMLMMYEACEAPVKSQYK